MHAVVGQEGKAMRRKLVVLFVAFASVFGVVACGGDVDVKEGAKEEAEEAQEEVQEAREAEKEPDSNLSCVDGLPRRPYFSATHILQVRESFCVRTGPKPACGPAISYLPCNAARLAGRFMFMRI